MIHLLLKSFDYLKNYLQKNQFCFYFLNASHVTMMGPQPNQFSVPESTWIHNWNYLDIGILTRDNDFF